MIEWLPDAHGILKREERALETEHFQLDEIELVRRYDEVHSLENLLLDQDQRQLLDFVTQALLTRIEHKISPSFRKQLEEEAQQTKFQEDPMYGRIDQHQQ
jgi:hypothetical protein